MRTQRYGNVKPLEDNDDAGFGPSYSSDPKGPMFVGWLDESFFPAVYALRTERIEEAWDHFTMVLCPEATTDDYSPAELAEVWEQGDGFGCSIGPDGSIRYTETLQIVQIR